LLKNILEMKVKKSYFDTKLGVLLASVVLTVMFVDSGCDFELVP
jgi:hypothetical protein